MSKPLALVALLALCACSNAAGTRAGIESAAGAGPAIPSISAIRPAAATTPIQHVIIMIQENRTYDELFGLYIGTGAYGAKYGYTHTGAQIALTQGALAISDMDHGYKSFRLAWNHGHNNGFDLNHFGNPPVPAGTYPYRTTQLDQIPEYVTLAQDYVLADHMFQTQGSGSFVAHQDLVAGGTAINATESIVDDPTNKPWGCDAPPGTVTNLLTNTKRYLSGKGPRPCLTYATLRDLLDAHGITWRYYTPSAANGGSGAYWNAFDAISAVRNGSEWNTNVKIPETSIFNDIFSDKLPNVAWVIPSVVNSDHPGSSSDTGPSWVSSVVNAVGATSEWKSTAIIIVWDDWGGWYDHIPPPQLDYQGLGFRVPCLIVSAYAKQDYVSHTQYEFGSILRFIEDNWTLGSLGTTDVRATSIAHDAFNFAAPPRAFQAIHARYSREFFLKQPPSNLPVDTE